MLSLRELFLDRVNQNRMLRLKMNASNPMMRVSRVTYLTQIFMFMKLDDCLVLGQILQVIRGENLLIRFWDNGESVSCVILESCFSWVARCHNPCELCRHWQHARTHDHQCHISHMTFSRYPKASDVINYVRQGYSKPRYTIQHA